jgi:chromosome segregation ATPase
MSKTGKGGSVKNSAKAIVGDLSGDKIILLMQRLGECARDLEAINEKQAELENANDALKDANENLEDALRDTHGCIERICGKADQYVKISSAAIADYKNTIVQLRKENVALKRERARNGKYLREKGGRCRRMSARERAAVDCAEK